MKNTINLNDFRDAFVKLGRANSFSYNGYEILFNYLEELEKDNGEEMEFDVVAIDGDYIEYGSVQEVLADYSYLFDIDEEEFEDDEDGLLKAVIAWLEQHTSVVCGKEHCIIICSVF